MSHHLAQSLISKCISSEFGLVGDLPSKLVELLRLIMTAARHLPTELAKAAAEAVLANSLFHRFKVVAAVLPFLAKEKDFPSAQFLLDEVKAKFEAAVSINTLELANVIRSLHAFNDSVLESNMTRLVKGTRFSLLATVVPALCKLLCDEDAPMPCTVDAAISAAGAKRKAPEDCRGNDHHGDSGTDLFNTAFSWLDAALSPSSIKQAKASMTLEDIVTSFQAVGGIKDSFQVKLVQSVIASDFSMDMLFSLVKALHAKLSSASANAAFQALTVHVMTVLRTATTGFKKPSPTQNTSMTQTWKMALDKSFFCAALCKECRYDWAAGVTSVLLI
jgi:hypothetical protein